jgi:formylmethanofuran dehydrogenase subunit E
MTSALRAMCLPMEPRCTRCNKRLSRKTARLIDGKILCSACVFPPLKKGLPS